MSKQRCEQLAKRLGAVITEGNDYIAVETPTERTFDGDVHERYYYYDEGDKSGAWKDVFEDLQYMKQMGDFYLCDKVFSQKHCDWCNGAEVKVGA